MTTSQKLLKEWVDLTKEAVQMLQPTETKKVTDWAKTQSKIPIHRWTKKQFLDYLGKKLPD